MTPGPGTALRDSLRRTLDDPSLEIVFPRVGSADWIDAVGGPAAVVDLSGRAVTPVEHSGRPIAALVHDPALLAAPDRLRIAAEAVMSAIDNERIKAALRAQLLDVQASRARIVEAVDFERRRVERNLHDGAQQRLVGLALTLRLAQRQAQENPALADLLSDALIELDDALSELRRLARGLHPAIVIDAGLRIALETLAERPGLPVDLVLDLPVRLPEHVEIAAFYLVAEALANTNKHAAAERVSARAEVVGDALHVSVADDGRGGAVAAPGSGLQGLADRVSALGGRFVLDSPADGGTRVSAQIPLQLSPDLDRPSRSRVALRWIGWENWEAPGVLYDQINDDDLLSGAKAILLAAGGNAVLTPFQRDWLVSYLTTAGDSDRVLEMTRTYDDAETLAEIMAQPSMSMLGRGVLYDAVRVLASDGAPTPEELARLVRAAQVMGVPQGVLDEILANVLAANALRRRRYELITAPMLLADHQMGAGA